MPRLAWTTILLFTLVLKLVWQLHTTTPSFYCLGWRLGNFLPKLVLSCDPPDLHLLSTWDYWLETVCPAERVPVQNHYSGLVLWLKWLRTCLDSTGTWLQISVLPNKPPKIQQENHKLATIMITTTKTSESLPGPDFANGKTVMAALDPAGQTISTTWPLPGPSLPGDPRMVGLGES
jgi:hypothetical protein